MDKAIVKDAGPAPSFPAQNPALEADDYVVYHGDDALAIFSAQDLGVMLSSTLNYTEKTLMIYAETVYLSGKNFQLPGKNLGIFCNQLVLSLGEACIDVSGIKGGDSTSTATKATDGGDGGSIWLYVEDPMPDLATKLHLKAFGGDGGHGASGKPGGGAGGDGGTCASVGVLKCYIGSAALRYGHRLNSVTTKKKWVGWVEDISSTISEDVQALISGGVDEVTAKSWKTVVAGVAGCLAAVKKLRDALSGLIRGDPERATPAQATVDRARRLLDALDKFVKSDEGPAVECDVFSGGASKEKKLQEAIDAVLLVATSLTSSAPEVPQLTHQLASFSAQLRNFVEREPQLFVDQTCELAGGKGGPGGSGTTPDLPSGKRGVDRPDKNAEGHLVSLSGTSMDCKIDQAIACPEQCQMILDAADVLYFTNDRSQFPAAMQKYTTLTRRLGFLDVLLKDKDSKQAPLAKALRGLETEYSLTIATLPQLDRIYQTALRRLNSMVYNQDIWGHSDVWVPRLSLAYYGDRVKEMIGDRRRG
ncbi:hypothetical protein NQ176_g10288 [Zarea fungicola]|uniref:Uncharacterized protein n=1 Tax=Zarea fungicola TaxID=93591 RepID=A0ACC1MGJ8_9HYPO|nr:hypothetical protein NQ176_g10288 [Lecanicillium fungicola]